MGVKMFQVVLTKKIKKKYMYTFCKHKNSNFASTIGNSSPNSGSYALMLNVYFLRFRILSLFWARKRMATFPFPIFFLIIPRLFNAFVCYSWFDNF